MNKSNKRKVHSTKLFDESQVTTSIPIKINKNKFAKLEDSMHLPTEDLVAESITGILEKMEKI